MIHETARNSTKISICFVSVRVSSCAAPRRIFLFSPYVELTLIRPQLLLTSDL